MYKDDLTEEFLEAETEKDYNDIFETWYNVYKEEDYFEDCSYILFVHKLLEWWFMVEKDIEVLI
jgi:hypothetical protein